MSRELMPAFETLRRRSGSGTFANQNCELEMTGYIWVMDMDYIEIDPNGHTYYYDFTFDCDQGNLLYIGFEKYDAVKTPTSNNSTTYFYSSTNLVTDYRVKGTINLATDSLGSPTKYIKLRVLNNWNETSGTKKATIKHMSLREVTTIQQPLVNKNGVFVSDAFLEFGSSASLQKNGISKFNQIIES